ncbi:MAG: hypothetical protein NTY77_09440 [Elusimicrobia bacterium]|nr:hypothetical protein [Elusimicrobiota bacterium]
MPEQRKIDGSMFLASLCALSAFMALSVISVWREVPFVYPPNPIAEGEQASSQSLERVAVLSFEDTRGASPYAAALRREASANGGGLVCELGADSNHLGRVDGAALARVLAQELARTGRYASVRYIGAPEEFKDETAIVYGKVLEAEMRIRKDGNREYAVGVELSAARANAEGRTVQAPFWQKTLRRKARAEGAPPAYEIRALVGALSAEAAEKLAEDSWGGPANRP